MNEVPPLLFRLFLLCFCMQGILRADYAGRHLYEMESFESSPIVIRDASGAIELSEAAVRFILEEEMALSGELEAMGERELEALFQDIFYQHLILKSAIEDELFKDELFSERWDAIIREELAVKYFQVASNEEALTTGLAFDLERFIPKLNYRLASRYQLQFGEGWIDRIGLIYKETFEALCEKIDGVRVPKISSMDDWIVDEALLNEVIATFGSEEEPIYLEELLRAYTRFRQAETQLIGAENIYNFGASYLSTELKFKEALALGLDKAPDFVASMDVRKNRALVEQYWVVNFFRPAEEEAEDLNRLKKFVLFQDEKIAQSDDPEAGVEALLASEYEGVKAHYVELRALELHRSWIEERKGEYVKLKTVRFGAE